MPSGIKHPIGEKTGIVALRLPVSIHNRLALIAEKEKISLNYLIGYLLARSLEDAEVLWFGKNGDVNAS